MQIVCNSSNHLKQWIVWIGQHTVTYSVESGIIPFGDTNQFLYSGQVPLEKGVNRIEITSKTIVEELFSLSKQTINFCLEPNKAYDDPHGSFFFLNLL